MNSNTTDKTKVDPFKISESMIPNLDNVRSTNDSNKWYLGKMHEYDDKYRPVYLEDFEWQCGWYWGGGYVGNSQMHCHFDGCFLDCPDSRGHPLGRFFDPWTKLPEYLKEEDVKRISNGASVWEGLSFFLKNPQYSNSQWWKIKELFKQFYKLRDAAEVFKHGGNFTSKDRVDTELNAEMYKKINYHIRDVIIPQVHIAMSKTIKWEENSTWRK